MNAQLTQGEKVAWLAGIYEAKGGVWGKKPFGCTVTIATDVAEVAERAKDVFGGGLLSISRPKRKTSSGDQVKPSYKFRIGRKDDVKAFRDLVWTFLSEDRRNQFIHYFDKAGWSLDGVEQ
jgi:hypothetical protein